MIHTGGTSPWERCTNRQTMRDGERETYVMILPKGSYARAVN